MEEPLKCASNELTTFVMHTINWVGVMRKQKLDLLVPSQVRSGVNVCKFVELNFLGVGLNIPWANQVYYHFSPGSYAHLSFAHQIATLAWQLLLAILTLELIKSAPELGVMITLLQCYTNYLMGQLQSLLQHWIPFMGCGLIVCHTGLSLEPCE